MVYLLLITYADNKTKHFIFNSLDDATEEIRYHEQADEVRRARLDLVKDAPDLLGFANSATRSNRRQPSRQDATQQTAQGGFIDNHVDQPQPEGAPGNDE